MAVCGAGAGLPRRLSPPRNDGEIVVIASKAWQSRGVVSECQRSNVC